MIDEIICGDALSVLKSLPDELVDCIITSPPYYHQRIYESNLGQEDTVSEYIDDIVTIFREAKRILKSSGTCWINIGTKIERGNDLMVPEKLALSMIEDDWLKKRTKIWWKPNYFGRNLSDDMKLDFEYVYLFVKSTNYHFDQQYVPHIGIDLGNGTIQYPHRKMYTGRQKRGYINKEAKQEGAFSWTPKKRCYNPKGKQMGSVWAVKSKQFRGSKVKHLSTFPEALVEIPIRAGCPEGGIVLDPFVGSGTAAIVAKRLRRHWIGIDINNDYCNIARYRLKELQVEIF